MPERDWKALRAMKDDKLATACARILEKVHDLSREGEARNHATYLALWRLLRDEDAELGIMFDDLRRSTALITLIAWRRNGLLSDDDLARFTPDTQALIQGLSRPD